ncbi:MAG: peptidase family C69 [Desulfobacterales bacterium CG23_combo_of_CG06-09_8_20_14_all_51_8]|nr:MAG: peptidase family C69 [Desulfobacterales bacterium CG23_combo_of_CG06-09_8_20_14_all_51_8]
MCDTHVLMKNNMVYFAKNSDREPGEAQLVVRVPASLGDDFGKLRTTYILIDQAPRRHGVILSKPFWIWGAEMGANDRGVVIGNEAIYSRAMEKKKGLIGMDLVRLGLERGDTADHALNVITELIEARGQGGVCGFRDQRMRYDNSFIIADPHQAWILETAGRFWVAKQVKTFGAISNCLTIGEDYDLKSDCLEDRARRQGFFKGRGVFSFKKTFDSRLIPFFAASRYRLQSSHHCLQQTFQEKGVHISQIMNNLRTHEDQYGSPTAGANRDICMHAGGFIRRSQTCGSMVSQLSDKNCLHFFTGTSAPCLSLFKPVSFDSEIDFIVLNPDGKTVDGSVWQNHEYIHRRLIFMDKKRQMLQESIARTENEMLSIFEEKQFLPTRDDMIRADDIVRKWSDRCFHEYRHHTFHYPSMSRYGRFWKKQNEMDGFNF